MSHIVTNIQNMRPVAKNRLKTLTDFMANQLHFQVWYQETPTLFKITAIFILVIENIFQGSN